MNTGFSEEICQEKEPCPALQAGGPDIKCFKIEGESGYSEFWRRDKSPVKALELTKLLISLRKIVSHVGRNAGTVSWKDTVESELMVDPGPVMGKYPVPASKTDTLIGETIRQAYRSIEMSDYAGQRAKSALDLSFRYLYKFDLFFNICEKVYADCLANNRIFGVYVEKSREKDLLTAIDATSHPPALSELFAIWWEIAADRGGQRYLEPYKDNSVRKIMGRASLETFYKIPVGILNGMVPALIHDCPKISGVTERCEFRARLYVSTWEKLFPIVKFWSIDGSDVFLQARKEESHQLKGMKKSLSLPELIFSEKLGKVIKKEPEPLKAPKKKPVNDDSVVAVEMNPIVLPAGNYVNKRLLQDLGSVFKSVAVRKNTYNRGLTCGNLDRRRLFRAFTTGTVFNIKKNEFNFLNDITLIVDATGSMAAANKWEHTQEIFQTLFLAILRFNKNAGLYAYNEVRNRCMLTELYQKGNFYTIRPHGKTASGEVIKTMIKKSKDKLKKPVFIHITDGASNWGCPVTEAISLCKKNRALLLTIGVNCSKQNRTLLEAEYGRLVKFADTVDMLPPLLRDLLNKGKRVFSQ